MFQYNRDFEAPFRTARDAQLTRRLNPRTQDFSQWLRENAARLPIETE